MDYIDYILPVYFDKAEEPDIQGNGFFIDKLFITAAHILEKDAALLKTDDIHPPKTGISVHFSCSLS